MTERLEAFTVRKDEQSGKSYWTRLGIAFPTKNGGWSIKLDALPVNGEIMLMPPKPKEDDNSRQRGPGGHGGYDKSDDIPFAPEWR